MKRKRQYAAEQNRIREKWEKNHPELAAKRHQFYSGKIAEIDFSKIEQKENISSRAASGAVLEVLANRIENMIVSSADLSNSDKTDGFLNNTHAFTRNDFSGAFLQAGVSELTMAAAMNGMSAHGGVIPAGGTFFVFSDYMKPAVRMAAIMELPVKYIWSHDAFRVGEDGPTHQPVEQEAQIRLLEHLKNHSGNRSVLVLRPADASETSVSWKMALGNTKTPTALILSRQGIKDLPPQKLSRFDEALGAQKGAYVVKEANGEPELIMIGSGSEVSTLYEAASILEKENGIQVRVISAISEGLFRDQELEYQEKILPPKIPTFGLTAGLPITLAGLVGPNGMALGLESFGFSAPAHVLDEKLGYTGEQVAAQALRFLKEK